MANELLALRGAHYSDRPQLVMLGELIAHNGNLGTVTVNKYWRNARKFAGVMLSSAALKKFHPMQINETARLVCDLAQEPSNYEYLFERYSSVVMMNIIYGKNISGTAEEATHVKNIVAITRTTERAGAPGTYLVDFLPFLKYLPESLAPFEKEARKLHEFEYSYFSNLVTEAEQNYGAARDGEPHGMVQAYFDDKISWDLSHFEISYSLGTLFLGGTGTTSSAMMSYCLAMWHHPYWQKEIQIELDEVVGCDKLPSLEDWSSLPTVRAAMKETLRWRPVVPGGIPHLAAKDDDFNGYLIPNGAIIHANQYSMFKDEARYPGAEDFNPDRWLNPKYPTYEAPLSQCPNLKRFEAFGFGRRICPGLVAAERSLFLEISMLMFACSIVKKVDNSGIAISVPWYDFKPGNNTGPKTFSFDVQARDEKRFRMVQEAARAATQTKQ